jgi:hypothetical protein
MPDYLVTYDLRETSPDPHGEFIRQSDARGWSPYKWGPQSQKWLRLPNTTLVGDFATRDAAKAAFDEAKKATEGAIGQTVTVEKYILVAYSNWLFDSDEKVAGQ